jgi:hypothetical protein
VSVSKVSRKRERGRHIIEPVSRSLPFSGSMTAAAPFGEKTKKTVPVPEDFSFGP